MKRGFTLIELMVVVGMLAILIGAIGSSVSQARKRAQVAKATQDAKEMTNAILAFENIASGRTLDRYAHNGWEICNESSLKMILGGETTESGESSPVLYNAQLIGNEVRDPWGKPYEVMIKKVPESGRQVSGPQFVTAPILPNFYRMTDEEKQ